jgi:ribosome-binding protein aMBF1 (putative translation factor)
MTTDVKIALRPSEAALVRVLKLAGGKPVDDKALAIAIAADPTKPPNKRRVAELARSVKDLGQPYGQRIRRCRKAAGWYWATDIE